MGKGLDALKAFAASAVDTLLPNSIAAISRQPDEHAAGIPGPQRVVVVAEEPDYEESVDAFGFAEQTVERQAPQEPLIVWAAPQKDDREYGDATLGIG